MPAPYLLGVTAPFAALLSQSTNIAIPSGLKLFKDLLQKMP
jgi:hypothetical protein